MSPPAEDSSEEERPPIEPPLEPEPRRYPSTIGGAFYLAILAVALMSLVVVGVGHWRLGVHVLAGCLVVAAGLRFGLPDRDAGMLAVRSRWIDVGLLAGLGVALWFLATTLPSD